MIEQYWMTEAAMAKNEVESLRKKLFHLSFKNTELESELEEYRILKKLVEDNIILKDDWDRFMCFVKLAKEEN